MSAPNDPNELPLFRDSPVADPSPQIPAWRPTPADEWARNPPSPRALESHYRDLLRRNLEVLQALARIEVPTDSPAVEGFWDVHRELVEHFVRMRQEDPELAASDAARVVPDRTHELVAPPRSDSRGARTRSASRHAQGGGAGVDPRSRAGGGADPAPAPA